MKTLFLASTLVILSAAVSFAGDISNPNPYLCHVDVIDADVCK